MSLLGVIFALLAAVIGGAVGHEGGFLLGLIVGYCLGAVIQLSKRVKELELQLTQLALTQPGKAPPKAAAAQMPLASEARQAAKPELEIAAPNLGTVEASMNQTVTKQQPLPDKTSQPRTPPRTPTVTPPQPQGVDWSQNLTLVDKAFAQLKAFFTDGNVVVKVGVLVLFIGVAFLLKYAAAHSMVPVELRVAAIGLGGVALLVLGWRLRARKQIYALLLQGGGVGVMYLTVFAAAKLYHLLPMGFTFAVMVALVLLSGVLAVLQNAKYLAFYGAAGGFLAPILASTGGGSHVMLFSYYALLNLGIVGIAWYRSWRELNLLGFAFTFVIGMLWGAQYYRPEFFVSVEPFLILFFLFFVIIAVLFALRQPPQLKGYVDSTLVFGVPIIAFGLQAALVKDLPYGLAFSALGMSAFYIALATGLWSRGPQGMRLLTEAFLAMGVVFGSLAIPLALDGRWTSAAWALEGAAIVWVGVRQQRMLARAFGLVLQLGSGLFFLEGLNLPARDLPILNGVFIGAMIVSIAGIFSSYYLFKHKDNLRHWEQVLHIPLLVWGLCWWIGSGFNEIQEYVSGDQLIANAFLLFVTVSLLLAHYMQNKLDWPMLRYPVLGQLYAMLAIFWSAVVFRFDHPLAEYGWLCWPIAIATLYFILYRNRDEVRKSVLQWQHMIGFWFLLVFVTWEAVWLSNHWIGGHSWRDMTYALVPALIMLFLLTKGPVIRWPIGAYYNWFRVYAAAPVMLVLALFAFDVGITHEGDPSPLPYVPLVNPVDLMVGFVLYLLLLWRNHIAKIDIPFARKIDPRFFGYALAAGAFLWMNGIIARSVHFWFGVAHNIDALVGSTIFQASISVVWTLTALTVMSLASKRGRRESWFVGLGLFVVTVIKLFLVDISREHELTMIISLIVVALLAIAFGYYLSPLPPRREEQKS